MAAVGAMEALATGHDRPGRARPLPRVQPPACGGAVVTGCAKKSPHPPRDGWAQVYSSPPLTGGAYPLMKDGTGGAHGTRPRSRISSAGATLPICGLYHQRRTTLISPLMVRTLCGCRPLSASRLPVVGWCGGGKAASAASTKIVTHGRHAPCAESRRRAHGVCLLCRRIKPAKRSGGDRRTTGKRICHCKLVIANCKLNSRDCRSWMFQQCLPEMTNLQ